MGFFTTRERAALGKSAELRGQGEVRELVRHDFVPPRRRPPERDVSGRDVSGRDVSGHVGTLMKRVSEDTLREVDDLIAKLKRRREQLIAESERVQRQIAEYAQMSQSTMKSTKLISESLASFKATDAPRMSEPHADDFSNDEPSDSEAETDVERGSVADPLGPDFEQEFAQKLAEEFPSNREEAGAPKDEHVGAPEGDDEGVTEGEEAEAVAETRARPRRGDRRSEPT